MTYLNFREKESQAGKVLRDWWKNLENNTGDRAALRRCVTPAQTVSVPAFHELHWRLKSQGYAVEPDRLLAVAALSARIRTDVSGELPLQMAGEGEEPPVSQLRFRRLLQCQDHRELFPLLRRALGLLDDNASLVSLADGIYWWNDRKRKDWAYAYFGRVAKGNAA